MLGIWLEQCRRFGIDEVLINLHAHADVVREYVRDQNGGVKVRIAEEAVLLGSAGTLLQNRDWVAREYAFWVFYADVLTNVDLHDMMQFHNARQTAVTLGIYEVPDPSRCGIVQVDDKGMVTQFVEKPAVPVGNLAFSGVLMATPEIFGVIPLSQSSDIGFHVLPKLVGRMAAYPIRDYLIDIGTLENYEQAQAQWPGLTSMAQVEHA
jgi:mannose-1-phosphate guanylyltransferase